uniref:Adenosine kinase n=1 Tax=Tetranychus truncatus TaxID=93132 RepID=A0A3G5AP30_9ACAR|nr:adenosine kinase 1-like [Tetranychus truncatus]
MSNQVELTEGCIFGLGNPLLDLIAEVDEKFLEKYGLKADDAILYEDKHQGLEKDMLAQYSVNYVAGGSVQNTMRITEWCLGFKPNICTFMGCIGKDEFGDRMQQEAIKDKLTCVYRIDENEKTGYCCVLISNNGKTRSLVAYLGAANHMKKEHLMENWSHVEKAKLLYVSGFHLTVCVPAILEVAQHAANFDDKKFLFNLSAPFICEFFKDALLSVLPYVDILFGNSTEALALASALGWETTEISEIAKLIAKKEKKNSNKPRIVVITNAADPITVALSDSDKVTYYPVEPLSSEKIVDTNGAGDAFVAGFISQYISNESMEKCIKVASYAAQQIIQSEGAQYPSSPANY